MHVSDIDAIVCALRSAFEILPRKELLASIEGEDPQIRSAALAGGGARIPNEKISVVLEAAAGDELIVKQAALAALNATLAEESGGAPSTHGVVDGV